MDASGFVERVAATPSGDNFVLGGRTFSPFAEFGDTRAYCCGTIDDCLLEASLPMPLGSLLYPSPVLWVSRGGIEWHWKPVQPSKASATLQLDEDAETSESESLVSDEEECSDSESEQEEEEEDLKTAASAFAE